MIEIGTQFFGQAGAPGRGRVGQKTGAYGYAVTRFGIGVLSLDTDDVFQKLPCFRAVRAIFVHGIAAAPRAYRVFAAEVGQRRHAEIVVPDAEVGLSAHRFFIQDIAHDRARVQVNGRLLHTELYAVSVGARSQIDR